MKPTEEQLKAEIETLKALKPRIRPRSMSGGNNKAAIDAMIDVLEQDLDEDEIYDRYDQDERLLDNALEARRWLDGEREHETLSEGWTVLIID